MERAPIGAPRTKRKRESRPKPVDIDVAISEFQSNFAQETDDKHTPQKMHGLLLDMMNVLRGLGKPLTVAGVVSVYKTYGRPYTGHHVGGAIIWGTAQLMHTKDQQLLDKFLARHIPEYDDPPF